MNMPFRLGKWMPVVAAILLVGCAPYIGQYYLPDASEGYLSSHTRLTSDEPLWMLERGEARFYFSAVKQSSGITIFRLRIQCLGLAEENSLSAKKRDDAKAIVKPIVVDLAQLRKGVLISPNGNKETASSIRIEKGQYGTSKGPMAVEPSTEVRLLVDQYLKLSATQEGGESGVYLVKWPPMLINSQLVYLPPVRFQWKSGIQIQYING